jgi:hypothetical protein
MQKRSEPHPGPPEFFFAVNVIPRTQIDLEVHKSEIISLYLQGHSLEDVRQYLVDHGSIEKLDETADGDPV